ncbi:unnamed protein product [Symbiodinium microadriaticum]|nr:unnamed protein product [Symbiodinium microadriaticum]
MLGFFGAWSFWALEAVEELFDDGVSTTTTGSDSIEAQAPGIVACIDAGDGIVEALQLVFAHVQLLCPFQRARLTQELEKTEELSGSDRDKIAANVHEQMEDKASGWLRWDQVDGANSSNATQFDLLWSHEHKECLESENIWTPLSMPDQSRKTSFSLNLQPKLNKRRVIPKRSPAAEFVSDEGPEYSPGHECLRRPMPSRPQDSSPCPGLLILAESCYHLSGSFIPLDMPEQKRTKETSYDLCQARCLETHGCSKFTYFIMDQGCHLQENSSHLVFLPGTIAGAASCPAEDKAKFDAYLKQLPMMRALESSGPPCEDSWVSFIPFDLPGDLDHPGDIAKDKEVKCETLYDHSDSPHICKHSSQVRVRCPKLCGECGIEKDAGDCADLQADEHPLFLLDNHTLGCASVGYACNHDEEVTQKCKYTCGKCTTTTTTVARPEVDHLAKVTSCGRRRSMGYCFTRRRRLF